MTKWMVFISRSRGDGHHHQAEGGTRQVHQRLQRIRQQADGAGDPPGGRLQEYRHQRHGHRHQQQALGRESSQEAGLHEGGRNRRAVGQAKVTRANLRLPTCTT